MMQRVFKAFSAKISGLHQAAYILGVFALLSSVLAFMRDRLLAHSFGAGIELDVYYSAFRIPDILFVVVASLVSAYALIPALSKREEEAQRAYIDTIVVGFALLSGIAGIIAFITAPHLLNTLFPKIIAQGFADELVLLTRIMLLQPILFGFSNILAAITQTRGRYVLYASTSVLYNFGIIIGIVFLYPILGLAGLAWGVVFGAVLHAGVQLPYIVRDGFLVQFPKAHDWTVFKETIAVSLPRSLALSMSQIVIFALVVLAGTMAVGSIAVFTLAFNLQSVPLAIIGASYSVAAFPTLAAAFSNGKKEHFVEHVTAAARHIFFWSLPAIALIVVLRAHLVRSVLGTGAFDWTDTRLTAAALALFAVSLTAHALLLLLVRAYYAAGRSWVPLGVGVVSALLSVALGAILVAAQPGVGGRMFVEALLRVVDVPGAEVLLLPFAYSAGLLVAAILLMFLFERDFGGFFKGVSRVFYESITAAGVGGFAAYGTLVLFGGIQEATTLVSVLAHGSVSGIVGLGASALFYWILGSQEFAEMIYAIRHRWTVKPVSSAEQDI